MIGIYHYSARRPLGVSVVAVLALTTAAMELLGGLALLGLGTFGFVLGIIALPGETIVNGEPLPWGEVLLTNLGFTLAALVIIGGAALNLLFGAGAWRLQAWAWWAGVVGNALPALGALLFLAQGQPIPGGAAWAWAVLLNLLVLAYLLTPGVRRLFGQVI